MTKKTGGLKLSVQVLNHRKWICFCPLHDRRKDGNKSYFWWQLMARHNEVKTIGNQPRRCKKTKVYKTNFLSGVALQWGVRLDVTEAWQKYDWKPRRKFKVCVCLSFSPWYVASLCLANAVVLVSKLSFVHPATAYK